MKKFLKKLLNLFGFDFCNYCGKITKNRIMLADDYDLEARRYEGVRQEYVCSHCEPKVG